MKIKEFITKLQNLSDNSKKIILWTIVAVLAVAMGYFWVKGAMNNLDKLGESIGQIKPLEIQTPAIEIPGAQDINNQNNQKPTSNNK